RGCYGNLASEINPRYASKAVAYDLDFGRELRFVSHLLEVAAAAAPEVRAWWLNAKGRRHKHLYNRSEPDAPLLALYLHTNAITRRCERDQKRSSFSMSQPHSARQYALDCDFKAFALLPFSLDCRACPLLHLNEMFHAGGAKTRRGD